MKHIYERYVTLMFIVVALSTPKLFSQSGTDFWFAPPEITNLHNSPGGEPLYLLISSMGQASTITISQPANGGFTPIIVNVAANKSARVNLTAFKTLLETEPTNTVPVSYTHLTLPTNREV